MAPARARLVSTNGASMALMTTRVLVLEDDDGLRTSLRLMLENDGYDVVEAAEAELALRLVQDPGVDLMLVDLMWAASMASRSSAEPAPEPKRPSW